VVVGFQQKQENVRRGRDAKVRRLLTEALALLEPEMEPAP